MDILDALLTGDPAALAGAQQQVAASLGAGDRLLVAQAEDAVRREPARALTFGDDGAALLAVGERTYSGGVFLVPTLAELRDAVAARTPAGGTIGFSVVEGANTLTDIGALQAWAGENTLFQVASQFNALESPGAYVSPVASYFTDRTQGPAAAVSAFPGAIVRHYACPDGSGGRFEQTTGHSLNLLADALPGHLGRPLAGYLTLSDIPDLRAAAAALESRFERIRVGLHDGVEVVLGAQGDGGVPAGTRIAQAFTAALAAGGYGPGITGDAVGVARQILRAGYLGTLLGAAAVGKRRVVLTMTGGGVFGNPHQLIIESIAWAIGEAESAGAGPLHVALNAQHLNQDVDRAWLRKVAERGRRA